MSRGLNPEEEAFINSLDTNSGEPNALDSSNGEPASKLCFIEREGEIVVYYDSGKKDSLGSDAKGRIGWVATSELLGKDLDKIYYGLIDAAVSPVVGSVGPIMKTIMGVADLPEPQPRDLRTIEENAKARRFNEQFARYSELSVDEVEALGLSKFVREPIAEPGHPWVYAVAANMFNEADNAYPAVRVHIDTGVWQSRQVDAHKLTGFANDSVRDQIRTLSSNADWREIDEGKIKEMTQTLAEVRQANSL